MPQSFPRKLLADALQYNESENQERGRYGN